MKYLSTKKVTEMLGVTAQTVRNWDRSGALKPAYVKSNGYRYYSEEQILAFTQERITKKDLRAVGYVRIFDAALINKNDNPSKPIDFVLNEQYKLVNDYLVSNNYEAKILVDYGFKSDFSRPNLLKLVGLINRKEIDLIVVESESAILGAGFPLFEEFAKLNNVKIIAINKKNSESTLEAGLDLALLLKEGYKDLNSENKNAFSYTVNKFSQKMVKKLD